MAAPKPQEQRSGTRSSSGKRLAIASWVLGAVALGAVVIGARHFSDERDFIRIIDHAKPGWLLAAVALQLLTYAGQAQVWRAVARAGGAQLSFGVAFKLSLAKLFVDQALPSGGLSGTLVFARALEGRGLPRPLVVACVVVDGASFYAAYVIALVTAVAIASASGGLSTLVLCISGLFVALAATVCALFVGFAGRPMPRPLHWLRKIGFINATLTMIEDVDGHLVRNPRLFARSVAYHVAVVLLDASTVWLLLLALGTVAPPAMVFASFMTSSLLRTVGILPGGLGTFDAASVLTLKLGGVPVAVALAATLAFRVLSFWLPMLPGLFFSREAVGASKKTAPPRTRRPR